MDVPLIFVAIVLRISFPADAAYPLCCGFMLVIRFFSLNKVIKPARTDDGLQNKL